MAVRSKLRAVVCLAVLVLGLSLVGGGVPKTGAATVGATVSGVVRDADTGQGVAGAVVTLDDGTTSYVATTGPEGSYSIEGVPADTDQETWLNVDVHGAPGTAAEYYVWDAGLWDAYADYESNPSQITLDPGETSRALDLVGMRGGIVSGSLSVANGPLPSGEYWVEVDGPDYQAGVQVPFGAPFRVAVPAGSYTVSIVPARDQGAYVTDGTRVAPLFDPVPDQTASVATGSRVELAPAVSYGSEVAHIVGVVKGPDGAPVSNAEVSTYFRTPAGVWGRTGEAEVLPDPNDPSTKWIVTTGQARTAADGSYSLNVLGGSAYRLGASPIADESLASARGMSYQFYPVAGCVADALSVAATSGATATADFALPYGTVLSGKLTDQLGRGPQGFPFLQSLDRLTSAGTWEAVAGSWWWASGYSLAPVPAGTYRLSFAAGDDGQIFKRFYYYQSSSASKATRIVVGAVSRPTTVTLKPSKFLSTYPSAMSVSPGSSKVKRNSTVKFSAGVWAGEEVRKGLTIYIYRSYDGRHWTLVKSAKTSSTSGKYSYSVKITRTVRYKFKYAGSSSLSSSSKTVTITAK